MRQEDHPSGVLAVPRQLDSLIPHRIREESVRRLDQDPGAVAGVLLGAAGAAMLEVAEHGEGFLHDVMGGAAGDVDDEAESAGVVLVAGIVEALG